MLQKSVKLHRKLPSVFPLTGPEVSVKVTATTGNATALTKTLATLIETTLQQYDHRVVIENAKPQTIMNCVITAYSPPVIQDLTRTVTMPSKNPFAKNAPTRQEPYKKVTGEITVSYSATDAKTRKTLDAAVLGLKVNREYEANADSNALTKINLFGKKKEGDESAPTKPGDVDNQMLEAIAGRVAQRVVTTNETVDVLLARGKLDQAGKLAESGLWPRMLEDLESMTPLGNPKEDAYRLYDLGVAYEAMGYAAPDPKQGFKLFEQAAINYGKAIDQDPTEKHFREPQNRIQAALEITRTLSERGAMGTTVETSKEPGEPAQPAPTASSEKAVSETVPAAKTAPSPSSADGDMLDNAGLVDLKKAGMDDSNLISTVNDAKEVKFDLSVRGLKELMQGGISNQVIAVMRQKVQKENHAATTTTSTPASRRTTAAHK